MDHLKIWFQIVIVIVGTGAIFDTIQMYRNLRYPFLKSLQWSILFFNLCILVGVVSKYLLINFFEDKLLYKTSILGIVLEPFGMMFFIALTYSLIRLNRAFRGKELWKTVDWIYILSTVLIILTTLVKIFFIGPEHRPTWMYSIYAVIMISMFGLSFGTLTHLLVTSFRMENERLSIVLKVFGLFCLSGYILLILSLILSKKIDILLDLIILLTFNLFPFIWMRRYLLRYGNALPFIVEETDLHVIVDRYSVSARQREILELLLQGKSNRDIANALFIAPNTVKNHVYGLYQKLGVKSRFELVNFLLEYAKSGLGG